MGRQLGRRPTGRLVVAGLGFCQAPVLLQEAKRKSWGWAPRHCLEQGLQRPVDLAQPEWLGSGPAQPPAAALVRAQAPAHVLQLPAECWALGQAPTA